MAVRVIVLVGPTAVGKSGCALALAEMLGGEIVSLDSRQHYAGMDIGTAKPTASERARVPHHLIDVADAADVLSLAEVLERAARAVADIAARGRQPILVGGTGQYVRAYLEGWSVPAVPPDPVLRAELFAAAERDGPPALHARLAAVDPLSAARLHPNNVRRVVRALEVFAHAGRPLSELQAERRSVPDTVVVGLARDADDLGRRIDVRIDQMIAAGLEDEVRALVARGVGFDHPNMSGVGYAEWRPFFTGDDTLDEVVVRLRWTTRRLVRKQALWFRPDDPGIRWVAAEDDDARNAALVAAVVGLS